ncbi:MAG: DNA-3-methyladenine glycosylase 2 family protein [Arenimonas sp.]|jgi:DNA-3-methyladenine glycosylase II|uniref:DNA-3-methyladenine glycosylase family protein n=1 Tax=Arenimonas sp. TaxID=1872635 RepID=UPI001B5ACB34|nr:DNA-3-methyladenine glycosylase 2 family protein [Arenimonas sp.]
MPRHKRGFDVDAARRALVKADPAFRPWVRSIGRIDYSSDWGRPFDVADALARAILYQQLSGKAAATIVGRVEQAMPEPRFHHRNLERLSDAQLRACGVSGNKTLALRDLARRDKAGEIPDARSLQYLDNEAIIAKLVPTRGIGRWTVEMMLMFRLGRPDILPVDDLGVRQGVMLLDGLPEMPQPKALMLRGEAWAPYRTLASFYLWRIADFRKEAVKRSQD